MQISYQYTDEEFAEHRQINNLASPSQWKGYGWILLCLLPSFGMLCLTKSFIAILSGALVLVMMILLGILAAIKERKLSDPQVHRITLGPLSIRNSHSHSESESNWSWYDKYLENETFVMFGFLNRYATIPKRILSEDQLAICRATGQKINSGDFTQQPDSESGIPNKLFQKLFGSIARSNVYQFRYQANDLLDASSAPLITINSDNSNDSKPKERNFSPQGCAVAIVAMVVVGFLLNGIAPPDDPWTRTGILLVLGALVVPFFLIKLILKVVRSRLAKSLPEVPRELNSTQLTSSGWAIGNEKSCQFIDWRDVTEFLQNRFCFAFRTLDEMMLIIPRRIFADESVAEAFISQAVDYRREHLRSFQDGVVVAVETGNPYQAPSD